MITDKSLPALPPNAIPPNAFSNDRVSPESDTPTELSPRPRAPYTRNENDSRSSSRPARSPERPSETIRETGLVPPAAGGYRNNRNSSIISGDLNLGGDAEGFFIPVALDPSPAPSVTPRSASDAFTDSSKKTKEKEYFSGSKPNTAEKKSDSQASTPHIAFQEKSRQVSSEQESSERPARKLSKVSRAGQPSPVVDERQQSSGKVDEFKLQDAPKSKRAAGSRSDSQTGAGSENGTPVSNGIQQQRNRDTSSESPPLLSAPDRNGTPRALQESRAKEDEGFRPSADSFSSTRSEQSPPKIARKDIPAGATRNGEYRLLSVAGASAARPNLALVNGKPFSGPGAASNGLSPDEMVSPGRPSHPETKLTDTYMQPRAPPPPPGTHTPKDSGSSQNENSPPKTSPKLPRWSAGGDFSMDEDMARILGTDEGSSSILRRVSNAVRHGRTNSAEASSNHARLTHSRSVSETTRGTASPRWPKAAFGDEGGAGFDLVSPVSMSATDDPAFLKQQLRNSKQRVAELERQFHTEKDLKSLNKRLIEKRKTVSVLDTQAEIMIRQLEVLAGYVERAKKTNEPLDTRELEDSAIKEFVQKLDKVKAAMAATIEQLHAERDELLEEKSHIMADRDRALLEFEQLSSKNAQLADMNNDLTHQIQEKFKQQIGAGDLKSPNGLGIYSHAKSNASVNLDAASLQTASTLLGTGHTTDAEEPILEGPTVVNIRKGQVKKFNWKKGSSKVAQNISKGINRAAGAFQQQEQSQGRPPLGPGDIGLPYNMTVAQVDMPITAPPPPPNGMPYGMPIRGPGEPPRQGFGFFGKKPTMQKSMTMGNLSIQAAAEAPSTLFGSELVERAEYERRQIPSVVTRCIEEVELRGMDLEGIYRKTGGNAQVKILQEGFDKSDDYDISDPNLDITAVTSVLKQYFRKLPNPLITFEVYDRVLAINSECDPLPKPGTRRDMLTPRKALQDDAEKCAHLTETVNLLPQKHRDCLEFLMFHLARVASRERENLVSPPLLPP